jgi:hypothetical protein
VNCPHFHGGRGQRTALARLVEAWPTLPATAKRMILAALDASELGM